MEICSEFPCSYGEWSLGNRGDPSSESPGSDGQSSMGNTGDPCSVSPFRDGGRCVHDNRTEKKVVDQEKDVGEIMSRLRDATSVVASLVATATFQAAVNPPSSVWKNDSSVDIKCIRGYHQPSSSSSSFQPPGSTTLQCPPPTFYFFCVFNAAGFITSILLLFNSIIDKWTPLAARLQFVSLTSLFLSYATIFITMTSNFSSFLAFFLIVVVVLIFFIPFICYISEPVLLFYNKLLGASFIYQRLTPPAAAPIQKKEEPKAEKPDYLPLPVSDYYPATGRQFERIKVRTTLRF